MFRCSFDLEPGVINQKRAIFRKHIMVSNQKFLNLAHLNQHLGQRFPVEFLSKNSDLLNQCFSDAFFRIVEVSKFVKFFPFAEASSWKTSCTSVELEGWVSSNLVVGHMVCQFYETENLEWIFRVHLENQPGYAFLLSKSTGSHFFLGYQLFLIEGIKMR